MNDRGLQTFLDIFGTSLTDFQVQRTKKLLDDLVHEYAFSESQLSNVIQLLIIIFSEEKPTDKATVLLGKIINPQNPQVPKDILLTRFCIKHLYPAVYDLNIYQPIQNCLLFMQPRQGLNETFRYLYRKLEKNYPYKLALYEMYRDTVSKTEYHINAAWFIRDMALARVVFVHESNNLMGYLNIRPETKIVQLWHGCGVFKHIGLSTIGKKGFKSMARYEEFPEYNKYSLVTIASPELSWVFEEFMGISKESNIIQPYGVCRTDEFFDKGYVETCFRKLYETIPAAKGKKIILYAPTYRGVDPNRVSPDALDIAQFAEKLENKYILIMKHHQTVQQVPQIPEPYKDTFAYDMTRGRGMNINELMTIADICITDYSSVAFEFSLFERPLLFFVYDLDDYIDNRGLYYNFDEITPGPLCRTNEEMINYIQSIEHGFDNSVIADFKNRFMCCCDGHACERTLHSLGLDKPDDDIIRISEYEPPKRQIIYSCDTARTETFISFQSGESFSLQANIFTDEYDAFAGWNMYQYGGNGRIWLCEDGSWHTGAELKTTGLNKRLLADQETLKNFTPWNDFPIYLAAQWKMTFSAKSIRIHTKRFMKKAIKTVNNKLFHRTKGGG